MDVLFNLGRQCLAGLRALVVLTVVLGVAYPLAVTGVARVALPWQASGSLVDGSGEHTTSYDDAVGSLLIGQSWTGAQWFHGRPSMAGEGYDPLATAGSNLGPESAELVALVKQRRAAVARLEGVSPDDVPVDAVTASASGLDPHISRAYADLQVPRIARERGLSEQQVLRIVRAHTIGRDLGVLGEQRVNVLSLNLSLRALSD